MLSLMKKVTVLTKKSVYTFLHKKQQFRNTKALLFLKVKTDFRPSPASKRFCTSPLKKSCVFTNML